jgi:hypothetical protein
MSSIGYVDLTHAKIKFAYEMVLKENLSLCVCVNYLIEVLFERRFERMCKARFLRGAF